MKDLVVIGGLVACAFVSGCYGPHVDKRSGFEIIDYNAQHRGTYIVGCTDNNCSVKNCTHRLILAEAQPDMASAITASAMAKLNIDGADAEIKADVIQTLAEVGKVTSANKFLRDALYRYAEMKASGTIEEGDKTFKAILEAAILYAQATATQADTAAADSATKQKAVENVSKNFAKETENEKKQSASDKLINELDAERRRVENKIASIKFMQEEKGESITGSEEVEPVNLRLETLTKKLAKEQEVLAELQREKASMDAHTDKLMEIIKSY